MGATEEYLISILKLELRAIAPQNKQYIELHYQLFCNE